MTTNKRRRSSRSAVSSSEVAGSSSPAASDNSQKVEIDTGDVAKTEEPHCNICGNATFLTGPGGRLSETGKPPRCSSCQCLERHRTLRHFYDRLRSVLDLSRMSCLQISDDRCVEPGWFASHAVSIYDGKHSLDIQALPIASKRYDCVICNHVLEHVPDDTRAMGELFRVVDDDGFLQIGVPDPIRIKTTRDWGFPEWSDHGHFRKYGIDIVGKLTPILADGTMLRVVETDPATGMKDLYFILTRSEAIVKVIGELYPDAVVDRGSGQPAAPRSVDCPVVHAESMMRSPDRFRTYVIEGRHTEVEGWVTPGALSAVTAFNGLQRRLGIKGHVCEIGVHHGRYFIALSLLRGLGERSLAVDVFDLQQFNVDQSGLGNLEKFTRNVAEWIGPDPDVEMLKADSLAVGGDDVTKALGGRVRLFSVDGSHTAHHTLNDLMIAEQSIVEGGLVVVDDFLNPAWPGVIEAIVRYFQGEDRAGKLAPIGYGDNKFYLTTRDYVDRYREHVALLTRFACLNSKNVTLCDRELSFFALKAPDKMLAHLPIAPGQKIDLTAPAAVPLLGAPSCPEASGTWALGDWVGVPVDLAAVPRDSAAKLTFDIHCFRHARDPEPVISCYVQGRCVVVERFPEGVDQKYLVLNIDRNMLLPGSYVEIWFHNPRAASPASLGMSTDGRILSILMRSVQLDVPRRTVEAGPVEQVA